MERMFRDGISSMNFLGIPKNFRIGIQSLYFCERLSEIGKDFQLLGEIEDQIMAKQTLIRKGAIQDTSLIESQIVEYGKPRDENINTYRYKDFASTTKNHESCLGYKAHTLVNEIKIIEKLAVTPANVYCSHRGLSMPGIVCYSDKGHFGSHCGGMNGTMDRTLSGHQLTVKGIRMNL